MIGYTPKEKGVKHHRNYHNKLVRLFHAQAREGVLEDVSHVITDLRLGFGLAAAEWAYLNSIPVTAIVLHRDYYEYIQEHFASLFNTLMRYCYIHPNCESWEEYVKQNETMQVHTIINEVYDLTVTLFNPLEKTTKTASVVSQLKNKPVVNLLMSYQLFND